MQDVEGLSIHETCASALKPSVQRYPGGGGRDLYRTHSPLTTSWPWPCVEYLDSTIHAVLPSQPSTLTTNMERVKVVKVMVIKRVHLVVVLFAPLLDSELPAGAVIIDVDPCTNDVTDAAGFSSVPDDSA